MTRWARNAFGLAMIAVLAWSGACRDSSGPGDAAKRLSQAATMSEPIGGQAASIGGASQRSRIATSTVAAAGEDEDVAYVSLPPGTLPSADIAVIRNPAHEGSITVPMQDGGFDPVPVVASPGDVVEIQLLGAGGADLGVLAMRVPSKKAPKVVRSNPPRGRADVPLNKQIVVVFSEPIDPASLTTSTIRVRRGSTTVAGSVRLVDGAGLIAVFTPNAPLAASARHRVDVSGVRDLQGDALDEPFSLEFTTGKSNTGAPAVIRINADTMWLTTRSHQLTATVEDAVGNVLADEIVVWSSSDPAGLSVSQTGRITALAEGSYTIFASVGNLSASAGVRVTSEEPVHSVTVEPPTASVIAEDTLVLESMLRDASGRRLVFRDVTWTTSDPSLATVSVEFGPDLVRLGRVITKGPGEVVITATSGTVSGRSTITITPPRPVASVVLAPASSDLLVGITVLLKTTLRSADDRLIVSRPISWRSANPGVATVDATGLVRAVAVGTADIIATAGTVSDTARITASVVGQINSVMAGGGGSCGLDPSGKAYCWGFLATAPGTPWPVAVETTLRFTSLTVGANHLCGIATDSEAYCWGLNSDAAVGGNALGHLGTGSTERVVAGPLPVTGGLTFASISAGRFHTCGLTPAGAAYCWGSNDQGQLGNGIDRVNALAPSLVSGGLTFASISAGTGETCGVTTTGAAYCWGSNVTGQLGSGSVVSFSVAPMAVSGGLVFASISAGGTPDPNIGFACGVTTDGAAYCWGNNAPGKLGDGNIVGTLELSRVPVRVSGGLTFSSVQAGAAHACGLTTEGAAYCWGSASAGRLGDGIADTRLTSRVPVAVAGGLRFSQLGVGGFHSCGLATGRTVYCWGIGGAGQLGHGSFTNSNVPVKVAGQP